MPRDPWDPSPDRSASSRPRPGGGARRPSASGWPDPTSHAGGATRSSRGPGGDGRSADRNSRGAPGADGRSADRNSRGAPGADGRPPSRDPRQVVVGGPQHGSRHGGAAGARGTHGPRHIRADDGAGFGGGGGGGIDGQDRPGRRSWPQRLVLSAGVVVVVLCLLGASVAGYALVKYGSIDRVDDLALTQAAAGEPENYLIVAVDTREGQQSRNTDTIMVVRVDPKSERLALTSFPRDLLVTIADTGELGMINSAYARDGDQGPRVLIDTLKQNFDITINHFVEVNFRSFQQVVDAIGGVSIYMDSAARDPHSGFYSEELGCVTLEGSQALSFVRSRYLDVMIDGEWEDDTKSDEHRVLRQQIFIQRAMSKALSQVKSNPLRLRELVDIGVSNITLDPNLGIGDILDLSEQFQDFDPTKLETYPLPVVPYPQNENRLLLDEAQAEPLLNVFRGLAPGEIRPGIVNVTVLNGTVADEAQTREGLATDVSGALQQVGFRMTAASDADTFYEHTTIEYAPGQEVYAQRVARHITSDVPIATVESPDLEPGHVTLIAGADFTTVHEQATPIEELPAAAESGAQPDAAAAATDAAASPSDTTTPTTTGPPATTSTTHNPFIIGAASERAGC